MFWQATHGFVKLTPDVEHVIQDFLIRISRSELHWQTEETIAMHKVS